MYDDPAIWDFQYSLIITFSADVRIYTAVEQMKESALDDNTCMIAGYENV